jgi:hypothetical protein
MFRYDTPFSGYFRAAGRAGSCMHKKPTARKRHMINFLEQLVAEWYEFNGYFVRRNVMVGRRSGGGWECELDVVALHPKKKRLVHIETSMDAASWGTRESVQEEV